MSLSLNFEEKFHSIKFEYDNDGYTSSIMLDEPYNVSKQGWVSFRDLLINDEATRLDFCKCNDSVSLEYKNGQINFRVLTGGKGGDGDVTVSFSKQKYGKNFINLLNLIINSNIWDPVD